jgi:uncharacterized protein
MKFQLTVAPGEAVFTGYGEGYVKVNQERYEHSVILSTGQPVAAWHPASFEALTRAHFEALLALSPEIVIFGAGKTLRFPHPDLTRPLLEARVGIEVMDTGAACRTYNILIAEGRRAVAAVLLP